MSNQITRSAEQRIKELEDELERMKPVVEAARKWRQLGSTRESDTDLMDAVDTYESATATPSTADQSESQK